MKIVYDNYVITVESTQYTLYKQVKGKEDPTKTSLKEIGYFTVFDSVIQKIIRDKMSTIKETVTLQEYLQEHKKMINELTLLING